MLVRVPILILLEIVAGKKALDLLRERVNYTAIGFTGHVSMLDEEVARERELKPLNRFERWLFKPFIEDEQARRRERFREACASVLGDGHESPRGYWV